MTNEQIEKFVSQSHLDKLPVQISFKTRPSISGLFIKTADYAELKSKKSLAYCGWDQPGGV